MKNQFTIILCLLFSTLTFAQKFEYTHNTTDEINLYNAVELNNKYLFAGTRGTYPNMLPFYLEVSKNGTFQNDSTDFASGNVGSVTWLKTDSSIIYQLIGKNSGGIEVSTIDTALGNYKLLHSFSDTFKYEIVNAEVYNDSIILMVGAAMDSQNTRDAFFYFLNLSTLNDSLINIGNSIPTTDLASDVLVFNDKYYIFKIRANSTPANCTAPTELMVLNQDFSVDTVIAICNSVSHAQGYDLYFIINALKLNSSTFMISGRSDGNNVSSINGERGDISVVKWDTNFTELNASIFGKRDSFALEAYRGMSRFENDSFVYVGGTENYKVNPSGYDTTTSYYLLSKVDLQGNVLWTRYYTNNTYLQLFKVLATSDGGALMVGTSYDHQNSSGLEKDVWIVKVDNNGDYRTSSSIPEMSEIPSSDYVFFPNPVKDKLTFRQVNQLREIQIELYDLNGKKVLEQYSNQSEQNIDVGFLAKGTYVYRLIDAKGNYASGKISKQ